MSTADFIARLHELQIRLWAEGDQLRLSAPKGALTPELREQLAARKEAVLAFLREAAGAQEQPAPIQPAPRGAEVPASSAQQRLWFLQQLSPEDPSYHVTAVLRLTGDLRVDLLRQSLNAAVARHEALRTTFAQREGQLVQRIAERLALELPVLDLRGLPAPEREAEAQRLALADAQALFDLQHGPLLRATLLQLDQQSFLFLLTIHHIVADGWSLGVLADDLAACYNGLLAQQPPRLAELPVQYADYAEWQRARLEGQALARELAYWRQRLAAPPALQLPASRAHSGPVSFHGARQIWELPPELTQALKAFSQRAGATLFMTVLAGFATLLSRYTGQDDLIIGTPIANRNRPEIRRVIGCFINTLALRISLAGNPSFRELLERVRESTLAAYAHQELPYDRLVEELQAQRGASTQPLFQVMFAYQNAMWEQAVFQGVAVQPLETDNHTSKFQLTLSLTESSAGLQGWFEYATDLFDPADVVRLIGHLQTLLEGVVAHSDQRVLDIPILTEPEQRELLEAARQAPRYPNDRPVHQLFAEQASRTPHKPALVTKDGASLSYAEIADRSETLARIIGDLLS